MNAEENLRRRLLRSMELNGDVIKGKHVPDADRRMAPRREDDVEQATAAALMQRDLQTMREQMAALQVQVNSLKSDRDSALKWGIGSLGAAVFIMFTLLFNLFTTGKLHP